MVGAADRVRRPARVAIDAVTASWTIGSEGKMAMRCTGLRAVRAVVICVTCELWPGVRRAGLGKG
jgi:hypothetical protein